jgi:two-component system, chemotaxis family, response regulator WspF
MRIAIVNDLALAQEVLRRLVLSVPGYAVAWTAQNGEEAVRKAITDRPDIILMDLVMPVMDGVEATRRIMTHSPCPILLVTSNVTGNFNMVYRALGYGGLDAVNTPKMGPNQTIRDGEGILARIGKLAREQQESSCTIPGRALPPVAGIGASAAPAQRLPPVLAFGASTGGPEALARILKALPARLAAAVVIIQHIAADFAPGLARWLADQCTLPVVLAKDGDELKADKVLLAGTDDHLVLKADRHLAYTADPLDYPYRPSVDVFFNSLGAAWSSPGIAVLLTGMGSDGARGLLQLRQLGWHTIAQDEASCVVYGMPKSAEALRAACQILPLALIPEAVLAQIRQIQRTAGSPNAYPSNLNNR